jgi:phospholipid/cholesterol/gamma-HCH transport system substrate-binding protein
VSDYESAQRWRNITVGVFVIIALCALVWLIFMFQDLPGVVTEIGSYQIFVKFPSAQGVQSDTPVRFCGYQIGRVTNVMPPEPRLDDRTGETYHQVMCVLSIDDTYKNIPSTVDIKVITRGLGSSYIEIETDPEDLEPNRPGATYLTNKMVLQGSTGVANEFFPKETQQKLQDVINGIDNLVRNANDILGDQGNKDNIKKSLENLSEVTAKASDTLDYLNEFSSSANEITEELSVTLRHLRMITEKIDTGDGTAGRFVNDGRLYENLLENTEQLDKLLQNLRDLVAEFRADGIKVKL